MLVKLTPGDDAGWKRRVVGNLPRFVNVSWVEEGRQLQLPVVRGRDLRSISSMFYEQLLRAQIPKAQKIQSSCQSFCAFGICTHKSCSYKTLMKLTPAAVVVVAVVGWLSLLLNGVAVSWSVK